MIYQRLDDCKPKTNWNGIKTYRNANDAYNAILVGLLRQGKECAPRGLKVKDGRHVSICIEQPWDNIVYSFNRRLPPRYLAGEWSWYASGSNKVEGISIFSKFWEGITNADGKTVNSNYGYYIYSHDYWKRHIKMAKILNKSLEKSRKIKMKDYSCWFYYIQAILEDDPDSRQAVIQIPTGFTETTKDTCCTPFIQFFIRDGKLDMSVCMRSTDLVKGFANDVFQFTMIQARLAYELKIPMGKYYHTSTTLHIYEQDWKKDYDLIELCESYEESDYYEIPEDYLMSEEFQLDLHNVINRNYEKVKDERLKKLISYLK